MMLSAHEFGAGDLSEIDSLSLVLARDTYEESFLAGKIADSDFAIFLTGEFKYNAFRGLFGSRFSGLIIPDVRIELDESSIFNSSSGGSPLGSIIRMKKDLYFFGMMDDRYSRNTMKIMIASDLPGFSSQVGFTRWSVTLGDGVNKRTLYSVDVSVAKV